MLPPKSLLVPGPWTAKGNTVKDGYGRPIATVFARNATAHAHWIAHLPQFVEGFDESQAIAEFQKDVDTLRSEIAMLKEKLGAAENQIENEVERANDFAMLLDDAKDEIADLKNTIRTMTRVTTEHI